MIKKIQRQRGQAIVLVALAILGLIAIAGLAIDGSRSFSSRRHAQTAADNAALAGALAKVNKHSVTEGALAVTLRNGYEDSTVEVIDGGPFTNCQGDTFNPVDPHLAGDSAAHYIEVKVRSSVGTYLGGIVGIQQINYCVDAVARALTSEYTSQAFGNAVAAVSCSGDRTIDTTGAADINITGGGLFSNSTGPEALYIHDWGPDRLTAPGLSVVGGADVPPGNYIPISYNAFQLSCPLPEDAVPKYTCGYYYDDFPPNSSDSNVTISVGTAIINPGVYCISGSFSDGTDLFGNEVTFIMLNEGIDWNGNTKIELTAPTYGETKGLLIMLPYSNSSEIRLNGTADQVMTGSVFAPASLIYLTGDFGEEAMTSQWIGNTVKMSGSLTANIHYDESKLYEFTYPPVLEMSR